MKKFLTVMAFVAIAGIANAALYWNLDWCIYVAYSPDASGSGSAALSPLVQNDYNITWSIVYGDNVQINPVTGQLVDGTYTTIDSMYAAAQSPANTLTWTDSGVTATYDGKLFATCDSTRYLGNAPDANMYKVYQYIFLDNGNDTYYWLSDGTDVRPTDNLSNPVADLGANAKIGPEAVTSANTHWTKTIPEPATLSLLGLGSLAMILRRKLRK